MAPPTVLVLDGDLGFLFALSDELHKRHMTAIPARTAGEALVVLRRLRLDPDLLVVNCRNPGACGLAEKIAKKRADVRIIAIVSDNHECRACLDLPRVRLRDPEDKGPERIPHCVDVIEGLALGQRTRDARGT